MRIVLQRVSSASVSIDGQVYGQINQGLLLLIGVEPGDNELDADWMLKKIVNMRIFSDEEGKMNLSVVDMNGGLLLVSQFTLHASTRKGNRPSFIRAAPPEHAEKIYNYFVQQATESKLQIATGKFGADMQVSLTNDGPVTIIIDSKNKE